jgi:hypothetical protein
MNSVSVAEYQALERPQRKRMPGGNRAHERSGTNMRIVAPDEALSSPEPRVIEAEARTAEVVNIEDARCRRARALLRDEEPLDELAEARAWNDRERAS